MDPAERLWVAARDDDAVGVERALAEGTLIDCRTGTGRTALHIAASRGNVSIISLLLSRGADIEARDVLEYTPLARAASQGKDCSIERLLRAGARVNVHDRLKNTPLLDVIARCRASTLSRLLEQGADLTVSNRRWVGPMEALESARDDSRDIKEQILSQFSPQLRLWLACQRGDERAGRTALREGANLELGSGDGRKALHFAAESGDGHRAIGWLLSEGADPNARDRHSSTPLFVAIDRGDRLSLELLLSSDKTDSNARDNQAVTPLLKALYVSNDADIVRLLLSRGASIHDRDDRNRGFRRVLSWTGSRAPAALCEAVVEYFTERFALLIFAASDRNSTLSVLDNDSLSCLVRASLEDEVTSAR